MPAPIQDCPHPSSGHAHGDAMLRGRRCVPWTYCPLCGLFALEETPGLTGEARQRVAEELRSYVRFALERDRAARQRALVAPATPVAAGPLLQNKNR